MSSSAPAVRHGSLVGGDRRSRGRGRGKGDGAPARVREEGAEHGAEEPLRSGVPGPGPGHPERIAVRIGGIRREIDLTSGGGEHVRPDRQSREGIQHDGVGKTRIREGFRKVQASTGRSGLGPRIAQCVEASGVEDDVARFVSGERGVLVRESRHHAGDVRRGHRGSGKQFVTARIADRDRRSRRGSAERDGREGAHARRRDVDVEEPIVGEARAGVVLVGGEDGDDSPVVVPRGIHRRGVRIQPAVSRRTDVHDAQSFDIGHRVLEFLAETTAAPGIAGEADVQASLLQSLDVLEAEDGVRGVAAPVRTQELARNEFDLPVEPRDADSVVGDRADRSGAVGAVPEVVRSPGRATVVHAGPAVRAVQVALEVRVREIDSRIDDDHVHVTGVGLGVPGCRCGNLGHVPLLAPERVGRDGDRLLDVVGLGVDHVRIRPVAPHDLGDRKSRRVGDQEETGISRERSSGTGAREKADRCSISEANQGTRWVISGTIEAECGDRCSSPVVPGDRSGHHKGRLRECGNRERGEERERKKGNPKPGMGCPLGGSRRVGHDAPPFHWGRSEDLGPKA